jgi:hypothetical protein
LIRKIIILASTSAIAFLALIAGHSVANSVAGTSLEATTSPAIVALSAVRDNTLYEENDLFSNGQGAHFFAGATDQEALRRGLLKFDIANNLPPDALVISATLQLNVSKHPSILSKPEQFLLHRLLADWGEGASDAPADEGQGVAAEEGDATWSFSFFSITPTNLISWTTPGGDFAPLASASTTIGVTDGLYYWRSSPGIIADLMLWLRYPDQNHGWLLKGNETEQRTARRFDSRENDTAANRPVLYVEYVIIQSRVHLPLIVAE